MRSYKCFGRILSLSDIFVNLQFPNIRGNNIRLLQSLNFPKLPISQIFNSFNFNLPHISLLQSIFMMNQSSHFDHPIHIIIGIDGFMFWVVDICFYFGL